MKSNIERWPVILFWATKRAWNYNFQRKFFVEVFYNPSMGNIPRIKSSQELRVHLTEISMDPGMRTKTSWCSVMYHCKYYRCVCPSEPPEQYFVGEDERYKNP